MQNYFCGWYYRCQSANQTLAVIPSLHRVKEDSFCSVQLITDTHAWYAQFPIQDYRKESRGITIGSSYFGSDGISLDIRTPHLAADGCIRFKNPTTLRYDIMGPFRYLPFLQCRHSVFSMRHSVDGTLRINGEPYTFLNGVGYAEGDRGRSFPKEYAWIQCSFPEGALMLSAADIPMCGIHFTGVIGVVLLHGKQYRLASYLGASPIIIHNREIVIQQGKYLLTVAQKEQSAHPLLAPTGGAMTRTIYEHPSCRVYFRLQEEECILFEREADNAAFEYEYPE